MTDRRPTHTGLIATALLGSAGLVSPVARAQQADETIVVVDPVRPREDEAASASVVTADRPARSGETMADLLEAVPGVAIARLGGIAAPALISLRGSSWEQVRVYVDGVDLSVASGGGVDLSTLPVGDLARVEVYRGVTPIAYGGSAIGGVVAVETRRPQDTRATVELGGGSFGTWQGGATAQAAGETWGLYAGVHTLGSRGDFTFVDDKGTAFDPSDDQTVHRQNNASREVDAAIRGYLTLPGGRELSVIALGFARDQGVPGYPKYATSQTELVTERGLASVAYQSRDAGASLLRAQLYGYGLEQRFRDPLGELTAGPSDARDRTFALGGVGRARWAIGDWLAPSLLIDARRESFTPVDLLAGAHGGESTRWTGVAGAEAALRIAAWDLAVLPSLRLDATRDVDAGRDQFGRFAPPGDPVTRAEPIARLGVTQAPADGVVLRANAGRYVRLPSFLELYGNTGFVRGNRDLQPEHGITADAGAGWTWRRGPLGLVLDAAGFGVWTDQLIQFQESNTGVARARNLGAARVLGVESSADAGYGPARLHAQLTWTDARDDSDNAASSGHQLPYRPRLHAQIRPELRGIELAGATLGGYVEIDQISGNYIDAANLVEIPSRTRVGAGISLAVADGRLRFIASADNLTGAHESDLLAYPLPGRAFYLTVALATAPQPKDL